ncbi:unnamed protein product [Caenorhabditis angaria]|uniref:Uncharacterized protein n=1 Tax=Caenorhabditis angaria TaxID=860376 RepID=A0A9P1N5X2_9PELO|nr:unnamed protein product [Caenorhabditis angaria]
MTALTSTYQAPITNTSPIRPIPNDSPPQTPDFLPARNSKSPTPFTPHSSTRRTTSNSLRTSTLSETPSSPIAYHNQTNSTPTISIKSNQDGTHIPSSDSIGFGIQVPPKNLLLLSNAVNYFFDYQPTYYLIVSTQTTVT